jgi:hypothetical protein
MHLLVFSHFALLVFSHFALLVFSHFAFAGVLTFCFCWCSHQQAFILNSKKFPYNQEAFSFNSKLPQELPSGLSSEA